jgi:hypothetical protein
MVTVPTWNSHYPDPDVLRKEIKNMCDVFVHVLIEAVPEKEVTGVYLKGSAQKEWDSPLDYVPEISDLDIHLLFANDTGVITYLGTSESALDIQQKVELRFFRQIPDPYHVPRVQLMVLNELLKEPDFCASPRGTISVLYGRAYSYPAGPDEEHVRRTDCTYLLEQEKYLLNYPQHAIDKYAKYLWHSLRTMVWHVSPTAPRVLSILGVPFERTWSVNRTTMVTLLDEKGQHELARNYGQFYINAWEYFLSHYENTDAGRAAARSGIRVLQKGIELARTYRAAGPEVG